MRQSLAFALLGVVASPVFADLVARDAFADGVTAQCVRSADLAQQYRDEGKYRAARENMLMCSQDICPKAVRSDCAVWLSELDLSAPTMVFSAKMGTTDVANMRILMDGTLLAEKLDGKPIMVDPGEHAFTFERDGRTEQRALLVQAGQKNRLVQVVFVDPNAPNPAPAVLGSRTKNGADGSRTIPIASYALTGVAVVGLAGFIGFGLAGKGAVDDMRKPIAEGGCAPVCDQDRVDSAKTKLLLGDISLGIGIGALTGAFVAYFLTPADQSTTPAAARTRPQWTAGATPTGAKASLSLSF